MGGTAEFDRGLDGPRGTGTGGFGIFWFSPSSSFFVPASTSTFWTLITKTPLDPPQI